MWSFVKRSRTVSQLRSGHEYMVEMVMFNVQRAITPKVAFYIVKLGFTGVYISFLISAQKQIVGTRYNRLTEAVLMSTHNLCFEQIYKKYQNFYLKTLSFWWWNFQYIWIGVIFMRTAKTLWDGADVQWYTFWRGSYYLTKNALE